MPQAEIEALAIAHARRGRHVVRLKGGDPFVFGRGGEEAEALHAAGIAFEVVPGISSAVAVPAYAGIPVTHREHAASFTVFTGHEDPAKAASTLDWEKLADPNRTLIGLMATANLREIAARLETAGLAPSTPVAVVQDGTRPTQKIAIGTLATIADEVAKASLGAPAIVIVGGVVSLRERLRWFDAGPLFGKRVLVTRAGEQAESFARALLARGAEPIVAPAIAIVAPDDASAAERSLDELASFAWIVFTSSNGVDAFFDRLGARGRDARALGGTKVAAIGERTAERLRERGIEPDAVPAVFVAEEVGRAVIVAATPGDGVLVYRAQEARDVLPRMLADAGLRVCVVPAYKTVVPHDPEFTRKVERADALTFTSASTVRGFAALLGGDAGAVRAAAGKRVACIGPITAAAAREAGLVVDVVASRYTTADLLTALEASFAHQR
jgi:uroporphyrinogen III methyltransferase/synthase